MTGTSDATIDELNPSKTRTGTLDATVEDSDATNNRTGISDAIVEESDASETWTGDLRCNNEGIGRIRYQNRTLRYQRDFL